MADTSYTARARVVTVPVVASFRIDMGLVMAQCIDLTIKVG